MAIGSCVVDTNILASEVKSVAGDVILPFDDLARVVTKLSYTRLSLAKKFQL